MYLSPSPQCTTDISSCTGKIRQPITGQEYVEMWSPVIRPFPQKYLRVFANGKKSRYRSRQALTQGRRCVDAIIQSHSRTFFPQLRLDLLFQTSVQLALTADLIYSTPVQPLYENTSINLSICRLSGHPRPIRS